MNLADCRGDWCGDPRGVEAARAGRRSSSRSSASGPRASAKSEMRYLRLLLREARRHDRTRSDDDGSQRVPREGSPLGSRDVCCHADPVVWLTRETPPLAAPACERVLDAGCGMGRYLVCFASRGRRRRVDFARACCVSPGATSGRVSTWCRPTCTTSGRSRTPRSTRCSARWSATLGELEPFMRELRRVCVPAGASSSVYHPAMAQAGKGELRRYVEYRSAPCARPSTMYRAAFDAAGLATLTFREIPWRHGDGPPRSRRRRYVDFPMSVSVDPCGNRGSGIRIGASSTAVSLYG